MASRNVAVTIILRAHNFASRVINGARGSFLGLRNSIFSTRTAIETFAAGMVVHGIKSLFDLGAQAEETANKFNTVFGSMSGDVDQFLKTFGILGGLSEEEGQAMVATTGQIAQGLGFAQNESAGFSKQILKTAVDMGSFNNAPTRDVLDAINSALTGIVVPLKQYGIVLRETDIQEKALSMTGKTSEKQLTKQEKATAALALITTRAGVAMGDMERTADSTANTARRLGAETRNVVENFGETLVASFKLAGGFGSIGDSIHGVNDWLDKNRNQVAAWGAFTIKTLGFVISLFKNLVKAAFNVGEIFGDIANLAGSMFMALLHPSTAIENMKQAMDLFAERVVGDGKDILDAANDAADALNEMVLAGQNAAAASRGEFDIGSGPKTIIPKLPTTTDDQGPAKLKSEVDALTKSADSLTKKFDLGLISLDEFRKQAILVGGRLTAMSTAAGITDESVVALRQSWIDLNKALSEAPHQVQIENLAKQSERLVLSFKSGKIDIADFVTAWERLRPAMEALKSSGDLTDEQLKAVQQMLEDINAVAEEIGGQSLELITPQQTGALAEFADGLRKVGAEGKTFGETMADVAVNFMNDFGGAIGSAFEAFATGSKSAGEAFKEAMFDAIASVARAQGQFYMGKAIGALGEGFLGNPAAFASAAKFTAAAALMFALAGTLGGLGHRGGGGGAAGGSGSASQQAGRLEDQKGDATLVIEGGFLDMNDPRQEASFVKALEDLSGRRVIVKKTT